MDTLIPFAPAALGVAGAMLAMLFDAWDRRGAAVVSAVVLLLAGATTALVAPAAAGIVRSGGFFAWVTAACLALGALALAGCWGTLTADRTGSRLTALGALAAASSALAGSSADIGVLFLAIEALALCGYAMVALAGTDRAREAAMKWFVQGSVATVVFVIGTAVLIGSTGGSLGYDDLAGVAATGLGGPMAVGFVLVFAAIAFKLGAFPFHSWMPDAYETAPTAASAVLASAGKVGPLAAVVWLALAFTGAQGERLIGIVAVIAVCSIVFGNLAALRQRSLARLLAYSGIAQVGYALVGVPLGVMSSSVLVFAVLYGLTAAGSFVLVEALHRTDPGWDGSIARLAGLSRREPLVAASLAVIMFSLTGIPLTAGFWGKFLVFAGASVGGYLWLAVAGVLGSVVSFGYYGAVIRSAYMDQQEGAPAVGADVAEMDTTSTPSAGPVRFVIAAIALLVLVAGVAPIFYGLAPVLAWFAG